MSAPLDQTRFDAEALADFTQRLLEDAALREVLQARLDQVLVHGHTAETDANMPVRYFVGELLRRVQALADGEHFQQGHATQRRRAIKLAALSLALLQRLDFEAAKETNHG